MSDIVPGCAANPTVDTHELSVKARFPMVWVLLKLSPMQTSPATLSPKMQIFIVGVASLFAASACAGSSSTTAGQSGGSSGACSNCGQERDCCDNQCVNLKNDPKNCGVCGQTCTGDTYCTGGTCTPRPCTSTCGNGETCCGATCCAAGQLCCDPQGPIETGATCVAPSDTGTCPMGCAPLCKCTSPDTPIATPNGERAMASLGVGDLVYSVDNGAIRAVPVARTNRMSVSQHEVVRVRLVSGAILEISGTHPTADGRRFYELKAGDELDHVGIIAVERIPYAFPFTYDILPASSTGAYFAGGVLIGSTLARGSAKRSEELGQ
jgi:hypothetical protein